MVLQLFIVVWELRMSGDCERLPFEGSSRAAGEGWLGGNPWPEGHPSVTFGDTAYAAGPLCRCATSPHTVGSHPSRGAT